MLKATQEIFSDKILSEALTRFGGTKEACKDLGGFEAFVYEIGVDGKQYILKITHTVRRTVDYIMGELDFVNYLASHGVPTSMAVQSKNGNFVESINASDGGQFLAYMFEKAEGRITKKEEHTDEIIQKWGEVAGLMNRLSVGYKPLNENQKRQLWYQDDVYNLEKYLPKEDTDLIPVCRSIIEDVRKLPISKESFGMIHGDLHQGNFFWNNGQVIPFDFDDCEYGYYINDIAMPLYYGVSAYKEDDHHALNEYGENFLSVFLKGYKKEFSVADEWILLIPKFLTVRSVILYTVLHQAWSGENLDDEKQAIINRFKHHVTGERQMLDIDYSKFV